jgi:hypothetical protein
MARPSLPMHCLPSCGATCTNVHMFKVWGMRLPGVQDAFKAAISRVLMCLRGPCLPGTSCTSCVGLVAANLSALVR